MKISAKLSISVAMCTYNGERFLPEQLASIAAQQRLPDEMVVCDDGSTDTTLEILEKFSRTVPFTVRIVRNPVNLGSTKNFEQAMRLCAGDLIALCDQDDVWLPQKLAVQEAVFADNADLGGVFSDAELIDGRAKLLGRRLWAMSRFDLTKQQKFRAGDAPRVLLERNVAWGSTLMVRSATQPLFRDIPAPWVHDSWMTWMIVLYSRMDFIEDPLIHYRLHSSQQLGIEELTHSMQLSLKARLKKGKREDASKHAARAKELQILYDCLSSRADAQALTVLPALRQAIGFFADCGTPERRPVPRILQILKNARNYSRYEHGLRALMRDLVLIFINPDNQAATNRMP